MARPSASAISSGTEQVMREYAAPLLGRKVSSDSAEPMAGKAKTVVKSLPEGGINRALPEPTEHEIEQDINKEREKLVVSGEMAVGQLCYAAMEHASDGVTNADQKLVDAFHLLSNLSTEDAKSLQDNGTALAHGVAKWAEANRIKAFLMVMGLGGTAFKAKSMAALMRDQAESFVNWGRSAPLPTRFLGFVGLMTARLCISTLVPPSSPGFGIILQAATPDAEKWTAMPLFLLASCFAGAVPYLLDKLLQLFCRHDFAFSFAVRRAIGLWPLTCWTGPSMEKVFQGAGGGKFGASLAVIIAHAAPFMGAQTTLMQRYFLPHPVDVIVSQPFGMSEDLLSMALAEASSAPQLASASVALLVCSLNLARFAIFTDFGEQKALATCVVNAVVGLFFTWALAEGAVAGAVALCVVAFQLAVQVLAVPGIVRALSGAATSPRGLDLVSVA